MSPQVPVEPIQHGGISRSTERRLCLLQVVLPIFAGAAARMYSNPQVNRAAKRFWIGFLTICFNMEPFEWEFQNINDHYGDLVRQLLTSLDKIVRIEQPDMLQELSCSIFPRLEAVKVLTNSHSLATEASHSHGWTLVMPDEEQTCTDLLVCLQNLAVIIKDFDKQPPPEDITSTSVRSRTSLAPVLSNLFSTLAQSFQCQCKRVHAAILLVSTHPSSSEDPDSACFNLLLSRNHESRDKRWQDTSIAFKENTPERKTRVVLPGKPDGSYPAQISGAEIPVPVTDLCMTMGSTLGFRLKLSMQGTSVKQLGGSRKETAKLEEAELITLEKGLITNPIEIDPKVLICIAVVLSYAMLDFCGEPWFPKGWNKRGITLLQHGGKLHLRPALVANILKHSTHVYPVPSTADGRNSPLEQKLLLHGILLMEIFNQEPLYITDTTNNEDPVSVLRATASEHFDRVDWDVYEGFREATEACIIGFSALDAEGSEDPERVFEEAFCKRVIGPLERDFGSIPEHKDKDPENLLIEKGILPSIQLEKPALRPKPPHLKSRKELPVIPKSLKPPNLFSKGRTYHTIPPPNQAWTGTSFFDAEDSPDHRGIQDAVKWFDRFDEAAGSAKTQMAWQLPPRNPAQIRGKGVKIAVLDTGIDLKNLFFQSKTDQIHCWPSDASCTDSDGHGTQIAYLLLRLAPRAKLKISKISNSRLLHDMVEVEEIAKRIRHFSSDEGDRVDIINISFGFQRYEERLSPILESIRHARDHNVLIFAAAGNEGGNHGVFWPASMDEVIDIHATDSYGNASSFSPLASPCRISTLGEAVPSCQHHAKDATKLIHRSGTSFATPIVAATAAIVIGFMEDVSEADLPEDFNSLRSRLRTKQGMHNVLSKTCVLQDFRNNTQFSYIAPWFFLGIEESSRVGIITNELRNCFG